MVLCLGQGAYALKILEKARMAGCNSCQTPMEHQLKLSKNSYEPIEDATKYHSLIGSLRYFVNTCPDLAFSVGYASRFLAEPHEDHMMAVKHILQYLVGIVNEGLNFKRGQEQAVLIGFTDSDFAGDVDSRKSTSGVIFFLN
jgi:hypothetical protein